VSGYNYASLEAGLSARLRDIRWEPWTNGSTKSRSAAKTLNEMRIIIAVACVVAVALAFGAGMRFQKILVQRRLAKTKANSLFSEASSYHSTLMAIRGGEVSNATEFMEFSLDCLVPALRASAEHTDEPSQARILHLLKAIKLYRERWPRDVNVELLGGDIELGAQASIAAKECRAVLQKVE
jgi:hypothetical protein